MIFIYKLISNLLYPVIIFLIFFRKIINKEDKIRYKEKIFSKNFNIKRKSGSKLIWFHAASIGELKSIFPIIEELNKSSFNLEFLITTLTLSSGKLAGNKFQDYKNINHRYLPVDSDFLIKKFIFSWKPNYIFLVDSEIWPNLILNSKKIGIPLAIINARITRRSYKRWKLILPVAKKIFGSFSLCLSSNLETQTYLEKLGANKTLYNGNIKFINISKGEKVLSPNDEFLKHAYFWCAVSTHKGEEEFCINVHLNLKKTLKNIVTIIAPRHINRVNEIKKLCLKNQLTFQILSKDQIISRDKEIIIINSFGVLSRYFKYSKSVFIGKSMLKHLEDESGQNPLEAARFGCKIFHGPYVYNFKEIYEILEKNKISKKIQNSEELVNFVKDSFNEVHEHTQKSKDVLDLLSQKTLNVTMKNINKFLNHENIQT